MRIFLIAILSALVLGGGLGSAEAQATRTWVSGVGDDANPCSRTAPCKTFAGAISKTAAAGEISVLDPGGFGAVTITKSISIIADGNQGSILASGTSGIVINAAASDVVSIKGLTLEGVGTGLNGIRILQAGNVYISDTVIRGFRSGTGRGIDLNTTTASRVYLRNVEITNNLVGISVIGGANSNTILIDSSVSEANTNRSMVLNGANASATAMNSVFAKTNVELLNGAVFLSTGNNFIAGANPTGTISLK